MRKGPLGHRFVAGAVAFPSSWSIKEKFGKTLAPGPVAERRAA